MLHGSSVILGPTGVGKRYLVDLIESELAAAMHSIGAVDSSKRIDLRQPSVHTSEELVVRELCRVSGLGHVGMATSLDWADGVEKAFTAGDPLRLFVTNIDSLSKELAFRLLTSVQRLVKSRHLVVVMTGEGDVAELVDGGPNSAWSCSDLYVVHAQDEKHFNKFLQKWMRQSQLVLPKEKVSRTKVIEEIARLCGGDVSLLRAMLWSITDQLNHHDRQPEDYPVTVTRALIPEDLTQVHIVRTAGVFPFNHATEYVRSSISQDFS